MWKHLLLWSIVLLSSATVRSQVVPDGTLGGERSTVGDRPLSGEQISGGAIRGTNLFHSFNQFNVREGGRVYFANPTGIQNILTRVTGQSASTINGVLGVDGGANLFLLNPNGILFGQNARLDLRGAFFATTADTIRFGDNTELRATDPAPLLTISVPIGFGFNSTPGTIQMQGTQLSAPDRDQFSNLTLIGGNVLLDNASVIAPGQRVEIAGIGSNGTVELKPDGTTFRLSAINPTASANVELINRSSITTVAGGGGEIRIFGRDVTLANESGLFTGIDRELGSPTSQAGDLRVDATGTIQLNNSAIESLMLGRGNSGAIQILGQRVELANGSIIGSGSFGQGNVGEVKIQAAESISLAGTNSTGVASGIFSGVTSDSGTSGNAGNLVLQAPTIMMRDRALIASSNTTQGNAGDVRIVASEQLKLSDRASIESNLYGTGRAGTVELAVGRLEISQGATVSASTFGTGTAGNVQVSAKTIALDGVRPDAPQFTSGIYSTASGGGEGRGGDVTVKTDFLRITNGATVSAATFGRGDAGNVQITAKTIALDGAAPNGGSVSGISSEVSPEAIGNGGNVTIQTDLLTATNGGGIGAGTFGRGNAGNVQVNAKTITLDGASSGTSSGIFSAVSRGAIGNGGNVAIQTDSLTATSGAEVSASTYGQGNAGSVQVNAQTIALLGTTPDGAGSGIRSNLYSTALGRGGDVSVKADRLTISKGAVISASTLGQGNAGNVEVTANQIAIDGTALQTASSIASEVLPPGVSTLR